MLGLFLCKLCSEKRLRLAPVPQNDEFKWLEFDLEHDEGVALIFRISFLPIGISFCKGLFVSVLIALHYFITGTIIPMGGVTVSFKRVSSLQKNEIILLKWPALFLMKLMRKISYLQQDLG